jgi:hypothetical protein
MYFPKSQVKPNLYTNGGEYILSTTKEEYKGYYYKISTGQLYTGRNPKEQSSILLEPYAPLDAPNPTQNFLYNLNPISLPIAPVTQLSPTSGEYVTNPNLPVNSGLYSKYPKLNEFENRLIPQFNPNPPTQQEKTNGQYTRYFCKRNNELKYIEIDLNTFTLLSTQSPQMAWDLYTPASTLWQIQGDKNAVYASNQSSAYAIEKKLQWYGFPQYFQGQFLKYYLGS